MGEGLLARAETGTGPDIPPRVRPRVPRRVRVLGFLTGALAMAVIAGVAFGFPHHSTARQAVAKVAPVEWQRPTVSAKGLADRTGVRLTRVSVTGAGGLLDLRYQVVDPDKAAAIHDAETPPAIIDERTGLVINQLFMGHSHKGQMKAAVTYYLVFESPNNWVHRGSKVTVLLGDAQVEHVVVS
jgi:hypothetical protein